MNTYCLSCKKDTKNIDPNINTNRDRMKDALWNAFN